MTVLPITPEGVMMAEAEEQEMVERENESGEREVFVQHMEIVWPYVEPVVQCYNCFMFGHVKVHCKRETKCIICENKAHGECDQRITYLIVEETINLLSE
ncbi:hypothetical protein DMN91_001631, partial [Ooceraea biroi]